jgi:pyrroline-5-carboxylate reductase
MARALANGFVEAGKVSPDAVVACDPMESAREGFRSVVAKARIHRDASTVVQESDLVFVAVKPQHVQGVFDQLQQTDKSAKLMVSIVAGVKLDRLSSGLGTDRVIRVMPNTPCLVGQGAAGFCLGDGASPEDGRTVAELLNAVGEAFQLTEDLIDAVTGLSGSGPAFVFQIIEALSDGGVRVGLPREVATRLAAQTVLGAASMVLKTGEHPGVLKDRVASPGGTTIAGLHVLENGGLRGTLMDAVQAATDRSKELG